MSLKDIFKKKSTVASNVADETPEEFHGAKPGDMDEPIAKVAESQAPIGRLDMVIAFDTTGSMSAYIDDVRAQVSEMIPNLFHDNKDLRLGIVAFGDYCDMINAQEFGRAYQSLPLTDNENDLIRFVKEAKNTSGGDGDEFYELVLKKIIDETNWRPDSTKAILLISDANPHPLGYSYRDHVVGNQIDWRQEATKAAEMGIRIDTVSIHDLPWYAELSQMTNGQNLLFRSSGKTARMMEASINARGSHAQRLKFDRLMECCMRSDDEEMKGVYAKYKKVRDEDV